ncbi:MAG: hypothetical protein APU95_02700 [Hadesarchaea archaeon YNP_N21]|jgi:membrane-associated protease RseP (regulator of RpoE activity)|nr:MAG: hypothetical protein APU95_02700 [Hadesarchaea archaeon YNP_N21]
MPKCPSCGKEVKEEDEFCSRCGAELTMEEQQPIPEEIEEEVRGLVEQDFSIEDSWMEDERLVFEVRPRFSVKRNFPRLKSRLAKIDKVPFLREREGKLRLYILPKAPTKGDRVIINIILFLATIGTTLFVGYQMSSGLVEIGFMKDPWQGAILFSAGIIGVLGCHELGHKIAASRRGVRSSLPYFIPVPFAIGTFGAIIYQKEFASSRNDLFDIAMAGPILGFMVLLPVTVLGIRLSYIIPLERVPEGTIGLPLPLIFQFLLNAMVSIPSGYTMLFHPLAFVGWVGMIVTMLNLMPAGMLDGGHVSRVIFGGRMHRIVSYIASAITFILGFWPMAILMLLFSMQPHPGPLEEVTPLTTSRKVAALLLAAILVLCAAPLTIF